MMNEQERTELPVLPNDRVVLSDGHEDVVDRVRVVRDEDGNVEKLEFHLVKKDLWMTNEDLD